MPDDAARPATMADMPVQRPVAPASPAAARARYFNSGNAFNVRLSPVPDMAFTEEPAQALAPDAPTGFVACDIADRLDCPFPATTPLVLARYARIRPGERLTSAFNCTAAIWYAISGAGESAAGGDSVSWRAGDVFLLPGGPVWEHRAGAEGAVLWVVTNEPQLAFEGARAPVPGRAPVLPVHYPAAEIERQIERIYRVSMGDETAGLALIFSSEAQEKARNITPTLTLAMNTLPPGSFQRPHLHNSVAVTLVVRGEGCYSVVDGRRKDWTPWATTITPPVSVHSHHNDGPSQARFLIVQDGGFYYHARTMGFEFRD